jgi:hypothetical protein
VGFSPAYYPLQIDSVGFGQTGLDFVAGAERLALALDPTNRLVRLRFSSVPAQTWRLQASGDFASWETLTNLTTGPDGTAAFEDPTPASLPSRFYRGVQP